MPDYYIVWFQHNTWYCAEYPGNKIVGKSKFLPTLQNELLVAQYQLTTTYYLKPKDNTFTDHIEFWTRRI